MKATRQTTDHRQERAQTGETTDGTDHRQERPQTGESTRLLFLAHDLNGVSCRFRVHQYVPYLRQRGWHVDVADLRVRPMRRWRVLQSAAAYDTICVHRAFLNPIEYGLLRRTGRHLVFDFDDAIMLRDSANRRLESRQRHWRFRRMVAGADRVLAGNRYLASWAERYARNVSIIPSAVDLAGYPAAPVPAAGAPVIGWIGTRINLMYLRSIGPALACLARRRHGVTLKIICDGFIDLPDVPVIQKPWALADEVEDLRCCQVGIMPLIDDAWSRGKCGVKILQYFAAGLPVVCSPVGANRDIVRHGYNGYFAGTDEEWAARLDELLDNPEKRAGFGAAGRRTVERTYSVQANIDALTRALLR